MANVSMNLGDKLIFDANDIHPNDTYLTNEARGHWPLNAIQVWLNGTKQAIFSNSGLWLNGDLEFAGTDPSIQCPHNLTLALATNGQIAKFAITANGTEMLSQYPGSATTGGKLQLTDAKLTFFSTNAANRVIDTGTGSIEVAGTEDLLLRVDAKNLHSDSKLRVLSYTTELATVDSAGATINVDTNVDAGLTVSGSAAVGTLTVSGAATFGSGVDAHGGGIRTNTVTSQPLIGFGGEIAVDTAHDKLWVCLGANTWKSVSLT